MKVIATTRKAQGTGASRRLRRADKLPGILYGGKEPAAPIELEHNPIFYALRKEKFHASILTMELDGTEQLVVLRDFQMHPYKPQVMHIDFQRIAPNENVTMRVPLHFHGEEESPAVKLESGMTFFSQNLVLPEGVTVEADVVIASVIKPVEEEVTVAGEAAPAAEAAPAPAA